jgi:hypothetical protein
MGQLHENQFYLEQVDGGPDVPLTVATEVRDNWCQLWKNLFSSNEFLWTNIRVARVQEPGVSPTNLPVNIPGGGLSLSAGVTFATYCIRKTTNTAGRKGRGRLYMGRLSSSNLSTNGVITATALASLNTMAANVFNRYGITGNGPYRLVVYSDADPVPKQVTSLLFDNVPRVQRRRNIGVGA